MVDNSNDHNNTNHYLKLLNREMTIAKTDGNISAGFETDSNMWRGYTNYIDVPSPY